jgi:hypothetical protein
MKKSMNHRGMALPFVLGIVTFVLALVATLLSYAIFQANLIDVNFDKTEEYLDAVQTVDATVKIIIRDENLEATYLNALASYMGVSIVAYSDSVWLISKTITPTQSVSSYLAGSSAGIDVIDEVFQYNSLTPAEFIATNVTPTSMLSSYIPQYLVNTFPGIVPKTDFIDFNDVVQYIDSLRNSGYLATITPATFAANINTLNTDYFVSGASSLGDNRTVNVSNTSVIYINGNLTLGINSTLNIQAGSLLVVDGTLTMGRNSKMYGNIVVNGSVSVIPNNQSNELLEATLYVSGNYTMGKAKSITLGTALRPTFVFSEGNISFGSGIVGYGYLIGDAITVGTGNTTINGGLYYTVSSDVTTNKITAYPLDSATLYSLGIPEIVVTEGSGSTEGFRFTIPV